MEYWKRSRSAVGGGGDVKQGEQQFNEERGWQARLEEREITGERHVRLFPEGALLGGLVSRGISPDLHVHSDGAGQFVLFVHSSCWVHIERPLPRLVPHNEEHRAAIEAVRQTIWAFYQNLNALQQPPDRAPK